MVFRTKCWAVVTTSTVQRRFLLATEHVRSFRRQMAECAKNFRRCGKVRRSVSLRRCVWITWPSPVEPMRRSLTLREKRRIGYGPARGTCNSGVFGRRSQPRVQSTVCGEWCRKTVDKQATRDPGRGPVGVVPVSSGAPWGRSVASGRCKRRMFERPSFVSDRLCCPPVPVALRCPASYRARGSKKGRG